MNGPALDRERTRGFAWDGVSFEVPADWFLAGYRYRDRVAGLTMEDDESVRLELEWTHPRREMELRRVRDRYTKLAAGVREAASDTEAVPDLPAGWVSFQYAMPENRRLVTAFYLAPRGAVFCFFRLHFREEGRRRPRRIMQRLASSFRLHERGPVPWRFYDVAFELPREFRLAGTALLAGRKAMTFEWRMRRLQLWFLSLADRVLGGRDPDQWAAEFLNAEKTVRGPRFVRTRQGGVAAVRSRAYPLGHFEEIGRWAFRYHVMCRHNPEQNRLMLALYHYRRPTDLDMIRSLREETSPPP